jgi:tyramine---L-glutamate ligase
MKVLLAEYAMAHDPGLAPEGAAMLRVLKGSFERCGYEVVTRGRGTFTMRSSALLPAVMPVL